MRRRLVSGPAAALAVVAVVALGSTARPAAAATCGDRVIADWRDGHFDRTYTPACLRQALQSLPEDLQIYSSAEDDISRLLNRTLATLAEPAARVTRSPSRPGASAPTHGVAAASATRFARTSDGVPLVVVILAAAAAACALAAAALAIRRRSARRGAYPSSTSAA